MAEKNPHQHSKLLDHIETMMADSPFRIVNRQPTHSFVAENAGLVDKIIQLGARGIAEETRLSVACRKPTYDRHALEQGLAWIAGEVIGVDNLYEMRPPAVLRGVNENARYGCRLHIGSVIAREKLGTLGLEGRFLPPETDEASSAELAERANGELEIYGHIKVNLFPEITLARQYAARSGSIVVGVLDRQQTNHLLKTA